MTQGPGISPARAGFFSPEVCPLKVGVSLWIKSWRGGLGTLPRRCSNFNQQGEIRHHT